jgi:nucleotide-binding universal stress UspA family protein
VGLSLEYGQRGTLVDGLASSLAADIPEIGDERVLSLNRCHVLQPTSLRILAKVDAERSNQALLATAAHLGGVSHGLLSLLVTAPTKEDLTRNQELLESSKVEVLSVRRDIRLTVRLRVGTVVTETVLESQEGYFDVVLLSRPELSEHAESTLPEDARHILVSARVPVIVVSKKGSALRRVLICTAGGEPGKSDVRLAARIARHTGAVTRVFHVKRRDMTSLEMARVDRHLSRAQAVLTSFGVESDVLVVEGEPIVELRRQIEQGAWDLVVIGASLHAILSEPLKSSFDAQVLNATTVPVLIVPTPD